MNMWTVTRSKIDRKEVSNVGLNPPGYRTRCLREKILDDSFNSGSPYYAMYHCGYYGVPIEDCIEKCRRNGIALRNKDIRSYNEGVFKRGIGTVVKNGELVDVSKIEPGIDFNDMKLSDFPLMPVGWVGTERRFFPCTRDNKPMQKWGYAKNDDGSVFMPELFTKTDAVALSPCGWVGQNMLYQRFIVLDVDGQGHGETDYDVIEFGNRFRYKTFSVCNPSKPGSFHLYFETDRLIPVRHFPWAKLDLMGNATNAAVYFKDKKWNGLPMIKLDESIWNEIMTYQKERKNNVSQPFEYKLQLELQQAEQSWLLA